MQSKRILNSVGFLLFTLITSVFISEAFSKIYVDKILMKRKLFEFDHSLGWRPISNLEVIRKDPEGNLWQIKTNDDGFRNPKLSQQNKPKSNVLILGDSFVFGEGVNLKDRFDNSIVEEGYNVLNLGVMGYGADQQYLASLPYLGTLKSGDNVILFTYYNDFYDILKRFHSGRSKPYFTLNKDQELMINVPSMSIDNFLRENSYIYSALKSIVIHLLDKNNPNNQDIEHSLLVYKHIVHKIKNKVISTESNLYIVTHGLNEITNVRHQTLIKSSMARICRSSQIRCVSLDREFTQSTHPQYFFKDNHWSKHGHKLVGGIIRRELANK